VVGLMNVQFAVKGEQIYVLEVNPRASRTVPFVSKACGIPLAKTAARCMVGVSLSDQGITEEVVPPYFSVKEAVFPFAKFPGVDPILGPEMKSTGEVMGVARDFPQAFSKALLAASVDLPVAGCAFLSVRDADKDKIVDVARSLTSLGFTVIATSGTLRVLEKAGISCEQVNKVKEGRPHILDKIKNDEVTLIVNTTEGQRAISDSFHIRRSALQHKVTYATTIAGAKAMCMAIQQTEKGEVNRLQDLHKELAQ
jgi:carbamoyl-phosphate synthase large subunit